MEEEAQKKKQQKKSKKPRNRRSTAFSKARKSRRKVIVLGSKKCGKTAFIKRFVEDKFLESYTPTVEDLFVHSCNHKGRNYTLQITDMASPFQFPAMRDLHIRAAELILLLYKIDSEPSFAEAKQVFEIVRSLSQVPVILVGTMEDLVEPEQRESQDHMVVFVKKNDIPVTHHVLTSAKSGKGICEVVEVGLDECRELKNKHLSVETAGDDSSCCTSDDGHSTTSSITGEDKKCVML